MADQLVKNIIDILEKTDFPENEELNPDALKLYIAGHDIMRMYRGDPDVLLQAMHVFLMTDVAPYAYAGAAKVIMSASYISGDNYDKQGISEGYKWLDKAQAMAPFNFEIDMIEAEMYNMLNQRDKFRRAIDELKEFPDHEERYEYAALELYYWTRTDDFSRIEHWAERARELAKTVPQELSVLRSLAYAYWRNKKNKQAIDTYRSLLKIDPNDAWTWHNLSLLYVNHDSLEALDCNRRALHLMEFGNAQGVQSDVIQKLAPKRHDDLIDEMPPFPLGKQGSNKSEKRGFFGRLLGNN